MLINLEYQQSTCHGSIWTPGQVAVPHTPLRSVLDQLIWGMKKIRGEEREHLEWTSEVRLPHFCRCRSPASFPLLGHAAAAIGASDDGRVATPMLGAAVVAALGRHGATRATPRNGQEERGREPLPMEQMHV